MLVYENSIAISSKSPVNFSKHVVILAVFYCHLAAEFLLRHLVSVGSICTQISLSFRVQYLECGRQPVIFYKLPIFCLIFFSHKTELSLF